MDQGGSTKQGPRLTWKWVGGETDKVQLQKETRRKRQNFTDFSEKVFDTFLKVSETMVNPTVHVVVSPFITVTLHYIYSDEIFYQEHT